MKTCTWHCAFILHLLRFVHTAASGQPQWAIFSEGGEVPSPRSAATAAGGFLFGGPESFPTNELWHFDFQEKWKKVSGGSSRTGIFPPLGTCTNTSIPGARHSAMSWYNEEEQIFYLYSGYGFGESNEKVGFLSDFWSWNGTCWHWLGGERDAVTVDSIGLTSVPPARRDAAGYWCQTTREFFLFGGTRDSGHSYNDLWKWTGQHWQLLAGNNFPGIYQGHYGEMGVPSPDNVPPSRTSAHLWYDPTLQQVFLFGGDNRQGLLNDVWQFDLGTLQWTWIHGNKTTANHYYTFTPQYGTFGESSPHNTPGGRGNAAVWYNEEGKTLYLFGGMQGGFSSYLKNDLWLWKGLEWTWIGGSSGNGGPNYYEAYDVFDPSFLPAARSHSAKWTYNNGTMMLFGGFTSGDLLNDLWGLQPHTNYSDLSVDKHPVWSGNSPSAGSETVPYMTILVLSILVMLIADCNVHSGQKG